MGYLDSVDVLSNVDDVIENWTWGELHLASQRPDEFETAKLTNGNIISIKY